jgi:hypothetical protein
VLTQVWKADWDTRTDSRGDGQVRRHSRHLKCWLQISRSQINLSDPKRSNPVGEQVPEWVCEWLRVT